MHCGSVLDVGTRSPDGHECLWHISVETPVHTHITVPRSPLEQESSPEDHTASLFTTALCQVLLIHSGEEEKIGIPNPCHLFFFFLFFFNA